MQSRRYQFTPQLAHKVCVATALAFMVFALHAEDALFVNSNGNVGIGTNAPAAATHLSRSDGTAEILVEETSGTTARRDLFSLINNGGVKFTLEDTSTGDIWDFSNRLNGFNINLLGTGGQEFLVKQDGRLIVGPGGVQNLVLDTNGNLKINGTLTENSTRDSKTAIEVVDADSLLAKLTELPIAEWQYHDSEDRHIGPMAEDFHAAYGLGPNNKSVAPKDMAGVAMAAAKALQTTVAHQAKIIEAQQRRIDSMSERLKNLEKLKDQLAAIQVRLSEQLALTE